MVSFGIGLALLLSGFTLYELSNLVVASTQDAGGILPLAVATSIQQLSGIPDSLLPYLPFVGIGAMIIGIVYFWVVAPIIYFTRPGSKPPESNPKSVITLTLPKSDSAK